MVRLACSIVASVLLALSWAEPTKDVALVVLLQRTASYVHGFERALAVVVADEDYEQEQTLPHTSQKRRMRSEVLFTWLDQSRVWFWVRNPTMVDGRPVIDSADRFTRIYADATADPMARLRTLRAEAARFNLGDVYRDFNDPTYALLFLDPTIQPRFAFTAAGRKTIDGAEAAEVNFAERRTPTLVQNRRQDVPAHGVVWIRTRDAAVVRTRLKLSTVVDAGSTATLHRVEVTDAQIDVEYARNAVLDLLLPSRMEERYSRTQGSASIARSLPDIPLTRPTTVERIRCSAVYSNFRRFETAARILPSKP